MDSLTLLEFNQLIKSVLDNSLDKSYWIIAEIGEMNVNQKGHCYLELVEKKDNYILAKNRATIWSYTFSNLSNWFENMTGTTLQSGMKVLVNASVQYHEVYGFSLNIKDVDPNFTIGERERKKQETIKRLEAEGIFDMNKSVSLPLIPQRIAIISSESAAGYGDFIHQLENNPYGYKVHAQLFQAVMQGDQAVESIIQSLHRIYNLENQFELVIIIRGGGAKTDLDCFDDYELCAHVAQFPLPVVTGIGHERDNTIVDLVANTRMKTPTAVAEFIISGFIDFESNINELYDQISSRSGEVIRRHDEYLSNLMYQLSLSVQNKVHQHDLILSKLEVNIKTRSLQTIEKQKNRLNLFEKSISAADPQKILERGFTITKINGQPMLKIKSIKTGDEVETTTKTGTIKSTVN
ncbi:exodeoxyribonuclease VII large subunit [Reichenbachiella sp. MALMAid0571]|uniref:exodeoxyribonuclease VII large subunit n=1 Tax=Reichenbachiella sp. MALMAid0571 TaxID=3143939 RepID=UPI0032DF243C